MVSDPDVVPRSYTHQILGHPDSLVNFRIEIVVGVDLTSPRIRWCPDIARKDCQLLARPSLQSSRCGGVRVVRNRGYNVMDSRSALSAQSEVTLWSIVMVRAVALN